MIQISDEKDPRFLQTFLALSGFAKPLLGGSPEGKGGIKDFYEECEWRYMPKWETVNEVGFPEQADFERKDLIEELNSKIKAKDMLTFALEDIRYLLVEKEAEVEPLYEFIEGELLAPKATLRHLTTRIHCYEELLQDV